MEAVVEPGNLKVHWPEIRSRLLAGSYTPQPVRRVEIPKASGGVRRLGVPTVLDRFIQQAVMQVLQEEWDPGFSDASYGFRPGRSAPDDIQLSLPRLATTLRTTQPIERLIKYVKEKSPSDGKWPEGRLQLVVVWSASPKPSTMTTLRRLRSAVNAKDTS